MISVTLTGADSYEVVIDGQQETVHKVTLSQDYYRELCGGRITHEWLIVQAMQFLLEREPNTAILSEFDLSQICDYFPEFTAEIGKRIPS